MYYGFEYETNRESSLQIKKIDTARYPLFQKSGEKPLHTTWTPSKQDNELSQPKIVSWESENDSIVEITDGEHECWSL